MSPSAPGVRAPQLLAQTATSSVVIRAKSVSDPPAYVPISRVSDGRLHRSRVQPQPRWCEVHHVVWWEKGGPTDLANLVFGCDRHHKQIHQGIINVIPGDLPGRFIVRRADGTPLLERSPPCEFAA